METAKTPASAVLVPAVSAGLAVAGFKASGPSAVVVVPAAILAAAGYQARRQQRLQRRFRGQVRDWFVKTGDSVVQGQLLAVVKPVEYVRGLPGEIEVRAQFDGLVVWTIPEGELLGWDTQVVGIEKIEAAEKPLVEIGRAARVALAKAARSASVAAGRVARLAEDAAASYSKTREEKGLPDH